MQAKNGEANHNEAKNHHGENSHHGSMSHGNTIYSISSYPQGEKKVGHMLNQHLLWILVLSHYLLWVLGSLMGRKLLSAITHTSGPIPPMTCMEGTSDETQAVLASLIFRGQMPHTPFLGYERCRHLLGELLLLPLPVSASDPLLIIQPPLPCSALRSLRVSRLQQTINIPHQLWVPKALSVVSPTPDTLPHLTVPRKGQKTQSSIQTEGHSARVANPILPPSPIPPL